MALRLARFKAGVEWFRRPEIFRQSKASRAGEMFLDRLLRGWLFAQGVDWPFSSPPPDRPDALLALYGGPVTVVVETALFSTGAGVQYRERGIGQAVWRAREAASAHGCSVAYVVVFNLSPLELRFDFPLPSPSGEASPFLDLPAPETRIRLLVVNVHPSLPTALRPVAVKPYEPVITAEYLLSPRSRTHPLLDGPAQDPPTHRPNPRRSRKRAPD